MALGAHARTARAAFVRVRFRTSSIASTDGAPYVVPDSFTVPVAEATWRILPGIFAPLTLLIIFQVLSRHSPAASSNAGARAVVIDQ